MPNKSFLEDMAMLAGGALNNLMDARHEIKAQAKQRVGAFARELDIVSRDEFDAAFAMLAKARDAQEDILARLAKIESKLGISKPAKTVKAKKASLPSVKTKAKNKAAKKPAKRR